MSAAPPCAPGCSYHVVTGPGERHLFVVVAGPANVATYPPQTCVLVTLSTIRHAVFEPTCIYEIGEHPFVTARSFVAYNHCRQHTVNEIAKLVANGVFVPGQPFNAALVARARAGLRASKRAPNTIKQFCAACP